MRPSEALERHRAAVRSAIQRYPVANPRVFGSTARGEDGEDSDLDIIVSPVGPMSYFDLANLQDDIKAITGIRVDVRTEAEFSPRILQRISRDFHPL